MSGIFSVIAMEHFKRVLFQYSVFRKGAVCIFLFFFANYFKNPMDKIYESANYEIKYDGYIFLLFFNACTCVILCLFLFISYLITFI